MANVYKNKFYDPSVTTAVTVYTCPSNANAIVQNIQITNTGGTVIGQAYISGKGANSLTFAQDGFNFAYQIGQTIAGASDTITLCAKGASNGDDICGTLKWVDLT